MDKLAFWEEEEDAMVHYIVVDSALIKNLTDTPITAYTSHGDFVKFPPSAFSFSDPRGTWYIVSCDKKYGESTAKKAWKKRAVAYYKGVGRDKTPVYDIVSYDDKSLFITPEGER